MSRCVDLCSDQPLLGSASLARWLVVVDQPRPWPSKTQDGLSLPEEWLERLEMWRAAREPVTLLARHSDQGQLHCFGWNQGQVEEWGRPGQPVGEKLLVCTHGSRDSCCGSLGPRLAQLLRPHHEVWEVSHIGGHRFAPTFWHLPSWRVYGRLPLDEPNWSNPRYLRGNAAYSAPLQVMEAHLFQQRGEWPLWMEPHEGGCLVHWPSGQTETWRFTLAKHQHRGPMSCRDIPQGIDDGYTSLEVTQAVNEQLSTS